jgi:hypothetical protein
MKTNESAGQLEKSLVRGSELLPADQELSRAIEPGEKPLHDPSPRLLRGFQAVGRPILGRLTLECFPIPRMVCGIQAHMRLIASEIKVCIHRVVIAASIQAEVCGCSTVGSGRSTTWLSRGAESSFMKEPPDTPTIHLGVRRPDVALPES